LLRRVRDFAEIEGEGKITQQLADHSLKRLEVDNQGLDYMDCLLLLTIIDKFSGGPVGLDTLAAAIGEERDTIEDVIEPYLIQQGFLNRTPRGRVASETCYRHFQRTPVQVKGNGPLFGSS
jgi:Holliday junction DNA helicase RuvB